MAKTFPGMGDYLDAAAAEHGVDPNFMSRSKDSWHASQIQDALGQVSEKDGMPGDQSAAKADIFGAAVQTALAAISVADACAAAVVDMAKEHGFPVGPLGKSGAISAAAALESRIHELEADNADIRAHGSEEITKLRAELDAEKEKARVRIAELELEANHYKDAAKVAPPEPPKGPLPDPIPPIPAANPPVDPTKPKTVHDVDPKPTPAPAAPVVPKGVPESLKQPTKPLVPNVGPKPGPLPVPKSTK